jgi:hypothetical protein
MSVLYCFVTNVQGSDSVYLKYIKKRITSK